MVFNAPHIYNLSKISEDIEGVLKKRGGFVLPFYLFIYLFR